MVKNAMRWMAIAALAGGAIAGCSQDYNDQHPPITQYDPDNDALQAKDVVSATDMLSADLLKAPELNKSQTQWTLAVDEADLQDETTDRRFSGQNYAIFLARLGVNLSQQGGGRVQLIDDPAAVEKMRQREQGTPEFAQGGTGAAGAGPAYVLSEVAYDMPNRATNYYMLVFKVTELSTRRIVWQQKYEVQVARN